MKTDLYRGCPACASVERRAVGEKNGFAFFDCRSCATLYTGEIPAEGQAEDYDEYYSESNLSVPEFVSQRVREIVGGFEAYRGSGRLLDIGFGAGTILKIAAELGWDVYGLEVSKPAVDQASREGFKVFHGKLLDAGYTSDHFDVITASEILEHLDSPIDNLAEVRRILRPGGLFWATTPSCRSLSRRTMGLNWTVASPPEHVQLFSRKGVLMMLRESGFVPISVKTAGLNPYELVGHFQSRSQDRDRTFDRVSSAYALNESMTSSPIKKFAKGVANAALGVTGLGDSIKIAATKR